MAPRPRPRPGGPRAGTVPSGPFLTPEQSPAASGMGPSLPLTPPCGLAQLPCPWSCPQVLNPTSDLGAHGAAQPAPACLPHPGSPSLGLCAGFRAASGPCAVSGGPPPGGTACSAGDFRGHSCGSREVGPVGTCRQGWAGFAVEGPLSGTTGGSSPAQLGQRAEEGVGLMC